jgi:hypothetical protein
LVSTYYPSSTNLSGATVVEAASGQDIAGIEIHMTRGPSSGTHGGLTITGTVTGAPAGKPATVQLSQGENFDDMFTTSTIETNPEGKFVIRGLQPGAYRLYARFSADKTVLRSRPVDLTFEGTHEASVQLAMEESEELTGTVEIDGSPAGASQLSVRLKAANAPQDGEDETTPAAVDSKGAFKIPNVSPLRFQVVVEGLPDNAFLQSVTVDGVASGDQTVDLSRGVKGSHFKIAISRNGAQISGAVLDAAGQPIASPLVFVFLTDDPKKLRRMNSETMNKAVGGRYSIKGIRPGKYRLLALDMLAITQSAGDADNEEELAQAIFKAAEEIEIPAGARIARDIKAFDKIPGKEPLHAAGNR